MRLGSLCSGIGGLDLAAEAFFGAELAWYAEIDPDASRVMAARWPGVANLGDLTTIGAPEPVDVLTAGFPCQPVSVAGSRKGTDDGRWLFDDICALLGRMDPRPRVLVLENVAGLLTANGGDAMARVVHGLAACGYVGSWRSVRAADAGAPHRRERVFIVAADAEREPAERRRGPGAVAGPARPARVEERGGDSFGDAVVDRGGVAADAERGGRGAGPGPGAGAGGPAGVGGQRPGDDRGAAAADPDRGGREELGEPEPGRLGGPCGGVADRRDPARQQHHPADAADTDGTRRQGERPAVVEDRRAESPGTDWGPYADAIARWEHITGRAAPRPVDDRRRLNPALPEWMMGLPEGWVCDVLERRTAALRVIGNAVCPQQAYLALSMLCGSATRCQ